MPGVPRFSANPLLQQVNNAAAQRGPAPRGSVPISTLLQNQATPDPGDGGLLGGVAIPPPPAPDSESILGGLQPGQFSARATDPFASEPGFEAPVNPGVGANDDSGQFYGGATSAEQAALQQAIADDTANARPQQAVEATGTFNGMTRPPIKPQGNVLDKFSSYTYQIGVYLLSPVQYEQFVKSKKKSINGYNLLFQSGGAPTNTGGFQAALAPGGQTFFENDGTASFSSAAPTSAQADAGRNPAFPLDFYIQECHVTNLLQGKGTGMSHSAATLKFTVIEPVGITLIDRIYQAVQDIAPRNSQNRINYANAQYLMVIRWFGYDQNGNITGGSSANTDPRSAVEKFIPFVINRINWRVNTKATEYEFDCTPVQQIVAAGTRRGVVPYDIQLSEGTVGGVLAGNLAYVDRSPTATAPGANTTTGDVARADRGQTPAPTKANAARTPKTVVKQGLMAAMNDFSQKLVNDKKYQFADQYEIVFAPGAEAIRDASIVLPDKKLVPVGTPASARASAVNPATTSVQNTLNTKSITAGQPIVQVIDQIIRNSSYITNQALSRYNEDNEQEPNSDNQQPKKPVNWYRINFEAVPIGNEPDNQRNDYAYKIRYVISAYKLDYYDSKYFPMGLFRGVHKSYPWIFTGQNTAIIDYYETLNTAYNMLISGSSPGDSAAERERRKVAATLRELMTYTYGPGSGESRQGADGRSNEPSANMADSLYGGSDLANTKLTIIGDPAWLQQGSLSGSILEQLSLDSSFLPDGTINFDAEQVCFEVQWRRASDYDLQTGLMDRRNEPPAVSRVYIASKVTSSFRQGQFTQVIDGLLFNLPKPDGSNRAPGAPVAENQSAAETNRLNRQNQAATVGASNSSALAEPGAPQPVSGQQPASAGNTPGGANPAPVTAPTAASSNGPINTDNVPQQQTDDIGFTLPTAVSDQIPTTGPQVTTFSISVGGQQVFNQARPAQPGENGNPQVIDRDP